MFNNNSTEKTSGSYTFSSIDFMSPNYPNVNLESQHLNKSSFCNPNMKDVVNDNDIKTFNNDNSILYSSVNFPTATRNRDKDMDPITYTSPQYPNKNFEKGGLSKNIFCEPDLNLINNSDYKDYLKKDNSLGIPFITQNNYCKPEFLHENIKNKSIDILTEFSIVIDSADRDIVKYPNPFQYRVIFNPVSQTTDAYVYRTFKNVKYIKLETAVLPRRYYFTRTDITSSLSHSDKALLKSSTNNASIILTGNDLSGNFTIIQNYVDPSTNNVITTFAPNTAYPTIVTDNYELINDTLYDYKLNPASLETEKYTLLNIDEFSDINDVATNQIINRSFSIMFPDYVNGDNFYTDTHFVDKIFKFSDLGNITSFTISMTNYLGNLFKNCINNSWIDSNINTPATCICTTDNNGFVVRNYGCACTYMRHPLYMKFQNTLMFKIGVVEVDIDKTIYS